MERLRWIVMLVDGAVALGCAIVGFLWALGYLHIAILDPNAAGTLVTGGWGADRWLALLACAWLILANVVVVGARWFSSKYDTHLRNKTPSGEVSITVYALEETLARLVAMCPEIAEVSVTVRKETMFPDKPVRITASLKAYEGISLKEITEKVKEIILRRYEEILQTHVKPELEVCVYKLIERPGRKEAPRKARRDVPSEEIFRGPVYPTDAEERS